MIRSLLQNGANPGNCPPKAKVVCSNHAGRASKTFSSRLESNQFRLHAQAPDFARGLPDEPR
jgi:hypothetical protein